MKLYEFILTYPESKEVYKDYRYFKSLKDCKEYLKTYGDMEVVRVRKVQGNEIIPISILESAEKELKERMMED